MGHFLEGILTTITTSPGNLSYYLVLAFSVAGSLLGAINYAHSSGHPQGRRMVSGLSWLLLGQVALFIGAGLAWQGLVLNGVVLPPLDRGLMLFSVVIIIWLWVFPEPARLADFATLTLSLLCGVMLAVGIVWWGQQGSGLAFNGTQADFISSATALGLLAIGTIVLLIRRPNGWGYGLGMFLLMAAGHVLHLLYPFLESDYAGAVRLAQMAAYPLLLLLPQRFSFAPETQPANSPLRLQERRRYGYDPALVQSILSIATEESNEKASREIVHLISHLMLADLCLLVYSPGQTGQLIITTGYDLIRETEIPGFSIDERLSPVISSALRRSRAVRLPASSTSPDLLGLCQALNMARVGHMLVIPLCTPGEAAELGLILLSPYSSRGWTVEDQAYLIHLAETLAHILHPSPANGQPDPALEALTKSAESAEQRAAQAEAELKRIRDESDSLRTALLSAQHRVESLAALVSEQTEVQEHLLRLETENQELKMAVAAPPIEAGPDVKQLEAELRLALEEATRLKKALSDADQKLLEQRSQPAPLTDEHAEVIASISQELRQPMSSIIGYTDLLLGESVGILGALQRKFLDRIKASTERMGGLIEDLIQTTAIHQGKVEITPVAVNLSTAIDEAIALSSSRLREKNITLRVDLPDQLPQMKADRDALQQILIHLLQNAGLATPVEGQIVLRARIEDGEHKNASYILLQVTDSGEGIPPEDLPRVFSRLYRADNPLIQGVGDTGVGLSIVKSLVEAHGGRIWVDSEVGSGSTFSVLLPLAGHNGNPAGGHKP